MVVKTEKTLPTYFYPVARKTHIKESTLKEYNLKLIHFLDVIENSELTTTEKIVRLEHAQNYINSLFDANKELV